MSPLPAAFLDRDGVLNELVVDRRSGAPESPLEVEEVQLIEGAAEAARRLAAAGFALVCVSNQPAAAKGMASVDQLRAVHQRVIDLLQAEGATLMASRLCLHHPQGVVTGLSGPCDCRKPAAGMLLDAAGALGIDLSDSWMVGDTSADIAAGKAAGCRTLLIENPGSAHKRSSDLEADLSARNLAVGTSLLLARRLETFG